MIVLCYIVVRQLLLMFDDVRYVSQTFVSSFICPECVRYSPVVDHVDLRWLCSLRFVAQFGQGGYMDWFGQVTGS